MFWRPTYREMLRDPRWQKVRLDVMARDGWACVWCGDKRSNLQVHHRKYGAWGTKPWESPTEHLVTACERCHEFVSTGSVRLQEMTKDLDPRQTQVALALMAAAIDGNSVPLGELVAAFCYQRESIISAAYSTDASRTLEKIDDTEDAIWSLLDAATPRTYGGP
jgi:hypothetical protein